MKTWKLVVPALVIPLWLCSCREGSDPAGPPAPPPIPNRPHRIALFKMGGDSNLEDIPVNSLKQGMKLFQFHEGDYYSLKIIDLKGDLDSFPNKLDETIRDKIDLIVITHPQILQAAMAREVQRPIVFAILGDPLVLGAGASAERHRSGLTGSYNPLPAYSLLAMVKYYLPHAKRVGVVFRGGEPLSVAHKDALIRDSPRAQLEIVAVESAASEDPTVATDQLFPRAIDAICLVVGLGQSSSGVIEWAARAKLPVFGFEEAQVRGGSLAAEVPIADRVGLEAGRMAYRVLSGERTDDIPFAQIIDTEAIVNTKAVEGLAITLPPGALRNSRIVTE
ncbi:ABC transporter substrate binding protein [Singulisphaera sp. Ch08]|uniref:ABC transporter substrate binding protein n=1 Tax=Singulisphaera sp. Ch08 TaxID=3120278 RepID=A0AAU7CQD7_9BACT